MELLVIDEIDFTDKIKVPSWKVNMDEVYEEWTDASYTKHREITRSKIQGSFTMLFDNNEDLDEFFDTIWAQKAIGEGNSVHMTVYVQNCHRTEEIDAFIKFTPANERPHFGRGKLSGFEVSIEEC